MTKKFLSILIVLALSSLASAQCPKCGQYHPPYNKPQTQQTTQTQPVQTTVLNEVNQARRQRGLRPFIYDPGLTLAAQRCAQVRASQLREGHLPNDFSYLPPGTTAQSAGCGAADDSWGWQTCCTYENYHYAGAAWVRGRDGQRYMHLFVR